MLCFSNTYIDTTLWYLNGFTTSKQFNLAVELILSGSLLQELEEGISSHQPSFAALNRTGDGIIQKLSPTDGSFLKDKLAGLNQRWGAIAAEVKDRRPR